VQNSTNTPLYVDSNVFLNAVLYDPAKNPTAKQAKAFLTQITTGKVTGITSVLTWDEFVWVARRELGRDEANEKGKEFLNFPNLTFKSLTLNIIQHAQEFLVKYNLRPRDALHIVTAIDNGLHEIVSFDGDLDEVAEIQRIDLMKS